MPTFTVPRLPRRRTLAASIAAGVVCSFLVTVAPTPASAQSMYCDPPHTSDWVTLYVSPNSLSQGIDPLCVGFVSVNGFDYEVYEVICSGNNSGTVTYLDTKTNTTVTHSFWPGVTYSAKNGTYQTGVASNPDGLAITNVTITGYSGSSSCAQ